MRTDQWNLSQADQFKKPLQAKSDELDKKEKLLLERGKAMVRQKAVQGTKERKLFFLPSWMN